MKNLYLCSLATVIGFILVVKKAFSDWWKSFDKPYYPKKYHPECFMCNETICKKSCIFNSCPHDYYPKNHYPGVYEDIEKYERKENE
jgi:hypothetical protein